MTETSAQLISLVGFAFVASITPGPNNFMVMASSAAFGARRTVPHMIGIAGGFVVMITSVVLGLGAFLNAVPGVLFALRIFGTLWLLWLAWQLAGPLFDCKTVGDGPLVPATTARPLRAYEAALFQWVNPKAWTMAIAISSAYVGLSDNMAVRAAIMAMVFVMVAPICNGVWMIAGQSLQSVFASRKSAFVINSSMVAMVVFSAVLINL